MSTTAIKWLALVLMLVDHLGEFFHRAFRCGFGGWAGCRRRCFCSVWHKG